MASDITSTSAIGAAAGVNQAQTQQALGINALSQQAQQDTQVAALVAQGSDSSGGGFSGGFSGSGGGNVTDTRGQNLNITV